jgi:hypothetical protein
MDSKTIQGHGSLYEYEKGQHISNVTYKIWWTRLEGLSREKWHGILLEVERLRNLESSLKSGTSTFKLKLEDGYVGKINIISINGENTGTRRFRGSGALLRGIGSLQ